MKVWTNIAVITLGLSVLASAPAFAKKTDVDEHSGKHADRYDQVKGHDDERDHESDQAGGREAKEKHQEKQNSGYVNEDRANKISAYYAKKAKKSTHCPPGLAKKNNGCQPPGQAKKWEKGQPLASGVVYHDVPKALLNELGKTPVGEKIVRVGEDILLINAVTGLVIDVLGSTLP